MLTDKDIKKLTSVFFTKKDLERFATKKDLEKFVTRVEFTELKNEFGEFRSEFSEFKSEIFTILDGIAKAIEDLKMEYVAVKL